MDTHAVTPGAARADALNAELIRIVDVLSRLDGVSKVILFGSLARGDVRANSDIDLLVVQDTPLGFYDRLGFALAAIRPRLALDLLVFTPAEFNAALASGHRYLKEVLDEGRVLYEA